MQKMQKTDDREHVLSDTTLLKIFLLVPPDQRRRLPAVSRTWNRICLEHSELWSRAQVSLDAEFLQRMDLVALYRWFLARQAVVRQLDFDISTTDSWAVIHGVLGIVGRQLQHLRVYGDSEACYEPGGRAAWMALVPTLTSLEVENAADWTIGACHFPTGLTHLELAYCGEEGLSAVPEHLGELASLASLSLQGSQLDGELDLATLQRCQQLQRLNLTDCCLEEVPRCLAALASTLTSLTLNSNSDLGGEGQARRLAPLAALTRLQELEMRECSLISVPEGATGLTSLRTLLLGLNDLAEPPFVLPGPYLSRLSMLGLSDCGLGHEEDEEEAGDGEDVMDVACSPAGRQDRGSGAGAGALEQLAGELQGAEALEVLRVNRNLGLRLAVPGLAALLAGKPRFRRLEFSEEMLAPGLALRALGERFPGVSFRAVD